MTETLAEKKFAIAMRLGFFSEKQIDVISAEKSNSNFPAFEIAIRKGYLNRKQLDLISGCSDPLDVVPGYRIDGLIGQGGVGTVFKATQLRMDRDVAIKTIGQSAISNETTSKRFEREAQIVGQLRHPNIVSAFDFGLHNEKLYLVMEFVDGVDGEKYLSEKIRLPESHAWHIALQVCHALDYANQKGIVHRDIKPGNLILTEPPSGTQLPAEVPFVKIADFGLARFQDNPASASITIDSGISGTPYYMAPEQIRGQEVGHHSDIYALGVTLWHMIAGYPPVNGSSALDVITAKMKVEDEWLDTKPKEISTEGFELLKEMCRYQKAERLDDYSTVANRIESVLAALDEDKSVPPIDATQPIPKFKASASVSFVGELEGFAVDQAVRDPDYDTDYAKLDETVDFAQASDLKSLRDSKSLASSKTSTSRIRTLALPFLLAAACLTGLYFAWPSLSGAPGGPATNQKPEVANSHLKRLKELQGFPVFLFDGFKVDPRGLGQGPGSKWESTVGDEGGRVLAGNGSKKFKCVDDQGENIDFFRFSFGFRHHEADQIDVSWLDSSGTELFLITFKPDAAVLYSGDVESGTCELPKLDKDSFGYHQIQIESQPGYWYVAIGTEFSTSITKPYSAESGATIQLNVTEAGSAHFEGIQIQPFKS